MNSLWMRIFAAMVVVPPDRVAVVVAAALVIGVFPVIGCPTAMCLAAAFLLRVNPAPLLAINHITSPFQVALLLPLARIGHWLCRVDHAAAHPALRIAAEMLHAVVGWIVLCLPLGMILYFAILTLPSGRRQASLNSLQTPA